MSEHPAPFELEAHHAGESVAGLEEHLTGCESCRRVLAELDGEHATLMARRAPADFARDIAKVVDARDAAQTAAGPWWRGWLGMLAAAAAAAVLAVAWPGDEGPATGGGHRLKGAPSVSLVVLRGDAQQIVVGDAVLRGGDRVRVALELPEPAVLTAGVLDADGSWLELAAGESFDAGKHYLESTFRVQPGEPLDATVLVGTAADVAAARAGKDAPGLARVRVTAAD